MYLDVKSLPFAVLVDATTEPCDGSVHPGAEVSVFLREQQLKGSKFKVYCRGGDQG